MTTIRVKDQSATITFDTPVYIGTTGDSRGMFPDVGWNLPIAAFAPVKYDFGTLVFDHADPARRNPLSPTLFQYWWDDGKLVVHEDFNSGRYKKPLSRSPGSGFSYTAKGTGWEQDRVYYTGNGSNYICLKTRVHLLDLLRFIEGKIGDIELEARAIA